MIKLAVLLVILILSIILYRFADSSRDIEEFCANVRLGDEYEDVYRAAKSKGLSIPFFAKEEDRLLVFNHTGPLFRVGCDVAFSNDRATKKSIYAK